MTGGGAGLKKRTSPSQSILITGGALLQIVVHSSLMCFQLGGFPVRIHNGTGLTRPSAPARGVSGGPAGGRRTRRWILLKRSEVVPFGKGLIHDIRSPSTRGWSRSTKVTCGTQSPGRPQCVAAGPSSSTSPRCRPPSPSEVELLGRRSAHRMYTRGPLPNSLSIDYAVLALIRITMMWNALYIQPILQTQF